MGLAIVWGIVGIVMLLIGAGFTYSDYQRQGTPEASSLLIIATGLIAVAITLHEAGVY